jgi:hypothetical protein
MSLVETVSSPNLDRPLQQGVKMLGIDTFSCLLENVRETIFSIGLSRARYLIQAARAIITEGPEGNYSPYLPLIHR